MALRNGESTSSLKRRGKAAREWVKVKKGKRDEQAKGM